MVGKDVVKNELYVARKEDNPWLFSTSCTVQSMNWFNHVDLTTPMHVGAKFRYRQQDQPVTIQRNDDGSLLVIYDHPVSSVTPGQEAVFYLGDVCLGGGVIEDVFVDDSPLDLRIREKIDG